MSEQLSKRDQFKTRVDLINSCSENFEWDIMRTVFMVTEAFEGVWDCFFKLLAYSAILIQHISSFDGL